MVKLYIDAAHSVLAPGAAVWGRTEWRDNFRLASETALCLRQNGIEDFVFERQTVKSSPERILTAFREGCEKIIVFHRAVSWDNLNEKGARVILPPSASCLHQYEAACMLESICKAGDFRYKGVHTYTEEYPYKILSLCPDNSIFLFETGYIDNPEDNEKFDSSYKKIASALTRTALFLWKDSENAQGRRNVIK